MPQVSVSINGHPYAIACDTGQEPRIRELAEIVDNQVAKFAGKSAQAGEARLLVLAALVLADEVSEAQAALRRHAAEAAAQGVGEPRLASGIERLAARIEAVASRLETPHI